MLEYTLAPNKFVPFQTEEAICGMKWLVNSKKINPNKIAVLGHSAGGHLALAFLQSIAKNYPKLTP